MSLIELRSSRFSCCFLLPDLRGQFRKRTVSFGKAPGPRFLVRQLLEEPARDPVLFFRRERCEPGHRCVQHLGHGLHYSAWP